jgi:hypothetical protein
MPLYESNYQQCVVFSQYELCLPKVARKAQDTTQSSWLSWFGFGSSSSSASTDPIKSNQLPDVKQLTIEEKTKLYQAIGYTDDEASYASYPRDYVNLKIKFILNKFEIALIDGEYKAANKPSWISKTKIISLKLGNMGLGFERRPVSDGYKIDSRVEYISLLGCALDGGDNKTPILILPQESQTRLIEFMYDHKPLDNTCTNRFVLSSKSLKFVYDSITVMNIANFFKASIKINRNK